MPYNIVAIPGDGIGPEVVNAAREVINSVGLDIQWQEAPAGQTAVDRTGNALPDTTLDAIRNADATLKGPVATASGRGFRSVNVGVRQKLNLFANYRPARSLPGIERSCCSLSSTLEGAQSSLVTKAMSRTTSSPRPSVPNALSLS